MKRADRYKTRGEYDSCMLGCGLQRCAILLRLQGQGLPSMAIPFGGRTIHWTFLLPRLTPAADGLVSAHPFHASNDVPLRVIEKLRKKWGPGVAASRRPPHGTGERSEGGVKVKGAPFSRPVSKYAGLIPLDSRLRMANLGIIAPKDNIFLGVKLQDVERWLPVRLS